MRGGSSREEREMLEWFIEGQSFKAKVHRSAGKRRKRRVSCLLLRQKKSH